MDKVEECPGQISLEDLMDEIEECPECDGTGMVICENCEGTGEIENTNLEESDE